MKRVLQLASILGIIMSNPKKKSSNHETWNLKQKKQPLTFKTHHFQVQRSWDSLCSPYDLPHKFRDLDATADIVGFLVDRKTTSRKTQVERLLGTKEVDQVQESQIDYLESILVKGKIHHSDTVDGQDPVRIGTVFNHILWQVGFHSSIISYLSSAWTKVL